jgi:high-affinity nickel permease
VGDDVAANLDLSTYELLWPAFGAAEASAERYAAFHAGNGGTGLRHRASHADHLAAITVMTWRLARKGATCRRSRNSPRSA